jgi:hypothetical protein
MRLPIILKGPVLSLALTQDPTTQQDRLIYVEEFQSENRVRSLLLSEPQNSLPITLFSSTDCKMTGSSTVDLAAVACTPTAIAVDPSGGIVFYDQGYRFIRKFDPRIKDQLKRFSTLAGTQLSVSAGTDRTVGRRYKKTDFGFSSISMLRYDSRGLLYFTQPEGAQDNQIGSKNYNAIIGKLDGDTITVIVSSSGVKALKSAVEIEPQSQIPVAEFKLQSPKFVAPLFDGSLLFSDGNIVLMLRNGTVTRFFGGKLTNADCGLGTYDRVSPSSNMPTLTNALSRFCSGVISDLQSSGTCLKGKSLIAMVQYLGDSTAALDRGWIQHLEVSCNGSTIR